MESLDVNQLLEGLTTHAGEEEEGISIYHVEPQEQTQDRERGFRVWRIGEACDRPTKCVLLLGETGAGKTTFINAAINHLFGVRLEDPFRLRVKEEAGDNRMETESQTDLITAYTIYYKEGMKYEYNFVLIDTPGLADTRGIQQQLDTRTRLEAFLTSDFGVDDLHCVGLVAKANTNRDFDCQKALLREVISLLGSTVPEITHIFATFAVDKPIVDAVMRNAGVCFKSMFQFDNGVLYSSQTQDTIVAYRWGVMSGQFDAFIDALIHAPSVSVKVLRERKLLDTCKNNLKTQIEKLATSIVALEIDKKIFVKYELQKARNEGWMQEDTIEKKITVPLEDGIHAHNCYSCQQTCVFPCYNGAGSGVLAGLAGGAGGTAAGAVISNLTTKVISSAAARAASTGGIAASVGNMAVRTFGGALTASELGALGAAGTTASLAIGGVLGIGVGLFTEAMFSKMTKTCGVESNDSLCVKDCCTHPLQQHIKEEKIIVRENEVVKKIDEEMKELYDVATAKKLEANAKIIHAQQKILSYRMSLSHVTVELMYHAKRLRELNHLQSTNEYVEDVTNELINEIRLGEPNIIPQAIKHVIITKKAMHRLQEYSTEEVLGKHELVQQLLTSIYKDH